MLISAWYPRTCSCGKRVGLCRQPNLGCWRRWSRFSMASIQTSGTPPHVGLRERQHLEPAQHHIPADTIARGHPRRVYKSLRENEIEGSWSNSMDHQSGSTCAVPSSPSKKKVSILCLTRCTLLAAPAPPGSLRQMLPGWEVRSLPQTP